MTNPFLELIQKYPELESIKESIINSHEMLISCIRNGNKILICGNGGSAADADHIVGELLKGFYLSRKLTSEQVQDIRQVFPDEVEFLSSNLQQSIPAISLVSGPAINTAIANDTNPQFVFAQQVYGLGKPGDTLIGISTSGNSKNVIYAAQIAKVKGLKVIALTGQDGGRLKNFADLSIRVPATKVADIQELHLPVYHCLCYAMELALFGEDPAVFEPVIPLRGSESASVSANKRLPEQIDLVVFDFDGVFTDNKVYTTQDGKEMVLCDRRDGLGIGFLKQLGIPMMILSTEENPVVLARAKKIGLDVHAGCDNKAKFLTEHMKKNRINPKNTIYVGNDLNDLDAMALVGFSVAPIDSHERVKDQASLILQSYGGHGAVREFSEHLLKHTHHNSNTKQVLHTAVY